jgi:hypothetical protein
LSWSLSADISNRASSSHLCTGPVCLALLV